MKVSREQVEANRQRILEAAGRLFRERGFEAVTVAEVMQAAGLTHGGFYGHFKSKDDLIAQTLAALMNCGQVGERDLATYATAYLDAGASRRTAPAAVASPPGAEVVRGTAEARAEMTAGLRRQIETLSCTAPGATPGRASASGDRELGGDGGRRDPGPHERRSGAVGRGARADPRLHRSRGIAPYLTDTSLWTTRPAPRNQSGAAALPCSFSI